MELPKYKCYKVVSALKIKAILNPNESILSEDNGERIMTFSDEGFEAAAWLIDSKFMRKHAPIVGGYYVIYEDGYKSFSPANAFESGYIKI